MRTRNNEHRRLEAIVIVLLTASFVVGARAENLAGAASGIGNVVVINNTATGSNTAAVTSQEQDIAGGSGWFRSVGSGAACSIPSAPVDGNYAAIAYSPSSHHTVWGKAWNYSSLGAAINTSIRSCGRPDCLLMVWRRSGCAAVYVSSDDTSFGWGTGPTWLAAVNQAINACEQLHGPCNELTEVCTY